MLTARVFPRTVLKSVPSCCLKIIRNVLIFLKIIDWIRGTNNLARHKFGEFKATNIAFHFRNLASFWVKIASFWSPIASLWGKPGFFWGTTASFWGTFDTFLGSIALFWGTSSYPFATKPDLSLLCREIHLCTSRAIFSKFWVPRHACKFQHSAGINHFSFIYHFWIDICG